MKTGFGHVLMVGGTGMLSGTAHWLATRSQSLTLVSRTPETLAAQLGATPHPLDWTASDAATRLPDRKFDLVISWLHKDGIWLARPFEDLLTPGGRSIRIHGSKSLDQSIRAKTDPNPRKDISRTSVILSWVENGKTHRWLNNKEISDGVISAIGNPEQETIIIGTPHAS